MRWPRQQMPSDKTFSTWNSIIRIISTSSTTGNLSRKLGPWTTDATRSRKHTTLIHRKHQHILVCENSEWWKVDLSHSTRSKTFFSKTSKRPVYFTINFRQYYPIDVETNTLFYFTSQRFMDNSIKLNPTTVRTPNLLQDFIRQHNTACYQLLRHTTVFDENLILHGQYVNMSMCSDGGSTHTKGSFGLVISCNNRIVLQANSRIPDIYEDINSHRSECMGLLLSVQILHLLQIYIQIRHPPLLPQKIILCCDNKSAVDAINKYRKRKINLKQLWSPNIDIIKGVLQLISEIENRRGRLFLKHITGHQDRQNGQLSPLAELNIKADTLATAGLHQSLVRDFNLSSDKAILVLHGKKVASNYTQFLRETFSASQMYAHYQDKYGWSRQLMAKIWWEAHERALNGFGQAKQQQYKSLYMAAAHVTNANIRTTPTNPNSVATVRQQSKIKAMFCNAQIAPNEFY
jgi:hypothetical protein